MICCLGEAGNLKWNWREEFNIQPAVYKTAALAVGADRVIIHVLDLDLAPCLAPSPDSVR